MNARHDALDRGEAMRACRRPPANEGCRLLRIAILADGFPMARVAKLAGAEPWGQVVSWLAGKAIPKQYGRDSLSRHLGIPWGAWFEVARWQT